MAIPIDQLASSDAPLATIVASEGGSKNIIGVISLFAVVNGALVQIIMASRVLFGMASQDLTHHILGKVHVKTKTPVIATALVTAIVLLLALTFPLIELAKLTSFVILMVFALVNGSLVRLKQKGLDLNNTPRYPIIIPICGLLLCVSLIFLQIGGIWTLLS